MEFGLLLSQFTDRWEHVAGDAALAEEAGLDSIWLVDHLLTLGDPSGPIYEGWTALSAVAARTNRVRLGHLVLAASFRNPGVLAKMAATLDHVSGGRLELGVGAGWYRAEYEAVGIPFETAGRRVSYLEEYIEVLRRLFAGEEFDFSGRYIEMRGARSSPPPIQEGGPPLVIGGTRPRMLDLAGRLADTWNCPYGGIPDLDARRAAVQAAAGDRRVRTTLQLPVAVGRDAAEAAEALEVGRVHLAWMGDIHTSGIVGTVEQAVDQLSAYAQRGVDGIVGVLPGSRSRPAFIEAYGELAAAFPRV